MINAERNLEGWKPVPTDFCHSPIAGPMVEDPLPAWRTAVRRRHRYVAAGLVDEDQAVRRDIFDFFEERDALVLDIFRKCSNGRKRLFWELLLRHPRRKTSASSFWHDVREFAWSFELAQKVQSVPAAGAHLSGEAQRVASRLQETSVDRSCWAESE